MKEETEGLLYLAGAGCFSILAWAAAIALAALIVAVIVKVVG